MKFNETWGGAKPPTIVPRVKHQLHIAGLFDLDSRNGAGSLGAALMAVEEINGDSRYLEDYEIVLHHHRSTKVYNLEMWILFFSFYKEQVGFQFNLVAPFVLRSLLSVFNAGCQKRKWPIGVDVES